MGMGMREDGGLMWSRKSSVAGWDEEGEDLDVELLALVSREEGFLRGFDSPNTKAR